MSRRRLSSGLALALAAVTWFGAGDARAAKPAASTAALGVDVSRLSPVVSHPYAPFSRIQRAVWAGYELDDETKDTLEVRVVMTVREAPERIAGALATVAEFTVHEKGALVERSWEYYAQDPSGSVFALGRKVDDIESDKVVGHVGQWLMGEKRARAGLYMPAVPAVGGVFEQGLAPGIAESRSKVTRGEFAYKVPAGDCEDCFETDVLDPASRSRSWRIYCRDKGRVEDRSSMHSLQLVELELRTPPPQSDGN